jgi:DNA (cytosine-5)-methyltransferase 1
VKVLDLFCGIGGLSWGFSKIGMDLFCAIDFWKPAIDSYLQAHNSTFVINEDVRFLDFRESFRNTKVDGVIGGPPCQAFSTVGKRALDDERATLVKEFLRVVREVQPLFFLFENVKGFTSFSKGELLKELLEEFNRLGYLLDYAIINAKNFAVPQDRERFIILGVKRKLGVIPKLPTENYTLRGDYWTFEEAVSDLPEVSSGEEGREYTSPPQNELQEFYRQNNPNLTLHYGKTYSEKLLKMMEFIPEGMSAHDVLDQIPEAFRPTSGFKNTYKRIRADKPCPTITRNFTVPSSSNCIHPRLNRALTIREGARIQSFPDDYPFLGRETHIREMIGNAVPPLMSLGLAIRIASLVGFDLDLNRIGKPITNLLNVEKLETVNRNRVLF